MPDLSQTGHPIPLQMPVRGMIFIWILSLTLAPESIRLTAGTGAGIVGCILILLTGGDEVREYLDAAVWWVMILAPLLFYISILHTLPIDW